MTRVAELIGFPIVTLLLGVAAAAALTALGVAAPVAASAGLALAAMTIALRNWTLASGDRPLLAEELTGLHERADALHADADDLRELLTELAGIVEDAALREQEATRALVARVAALETMAFGPSARGGESGAPDGAGDEDRLFDATGAGGLAARLRAEIEPLEARLERFDARTRKLALAVERGLAAQGLDVQSQSAPSPSTLGQSVQEDSIEHGVNEQNVEGARVDADATATLARAASALRANAGAPSGALSGAAGDAVSVGAAAPVGGASNEDGAATPLEAATEAASGRYALMLQAAFAMPEGEPRFFESYTRREDGDGAIAGAADHVEPAKADGTIGVIDNLQLSRSVAAAEQLRAAGRDVAIFCNLSMVSLRDPAYLRTILSFLKRNTALAEHIVFEFGQLEIDSISDPDVAILQRLRETGFAFSIDHIEDWSIDIQTLSKLGFRYVKLDAATVLAREAGSPGAVRRLMTSFEREGLTLIVEKVESAKDAQALQEAGARLLQGAALAEPRRIRVDEDAFAELEAAARRAVLAGRALAEARGERRRNSIAPERAAPLGEGSTDREFRDWPSLARSFAGATVPAPAHGRPD
ncbi:MAG: EAL domain-containing protein [Pseudomonadota bacterium]